MRITQPLKHFLRLPLDQQIDQEVRKYYKRNFIYNSLDGVFWIFGESFVSVNTILPVFAATLTNSPLIIGLVPALIHAGWFIPQLLMAGYVQRLSRKMPFARLMALIERFPYMLLPLTAYLLNWIPAQSALILFMIVITLRGLASGMIALPWQEVIATVIPMPVRSRFFGISRTFGRLMGVIGSVITGLILASRTYPNNYALSFLIGAVFIWISFVFFSRTVEPAANRSESEKSLVSDKSVWNDFQAYKKILTLDKNFVKFLFSRILFQLSSMAIAFLAVFGIQEYGLLDEQAAVFTGILFFSGTIGFAVYGLIGDSLGPRKVLLSADFLQAIALLLAFINPGLWSIYVIFLIIGFAQSGYIIGELIIAMELGPIDKRPAYIGLARTLPGFFILVSPLIGGYIVGQYSYQVMFLVALVFSACGIMILMGVRDRKLT